MSAPRKIWAYDDGLNSPDSRSWSATVPVGPAYHHDDVVRELVEIARDVDQWMRGERGYERVGYGTKLRAALAKIAQEG